MPQGAPTHAVSEGAGWGQPRQVSFGYLWLQVAADPWGEGVSRGMTLVFWLVVQLRFLRIHKAHQPGLQAEH